jgi:tetratricopeptide (TPR) repeat protein
MDTPAEKTTLAMVGARIRELRRLKGLTQEGLAGSEFTKGYVSALERGAVRPSFKALEVFARRLEVPISDFLTVSQQLSTEPDLDAVQEDLIYQSNYTKMLIRAGQVEEALELIAEIEQSAQPYQASLSPEVAYLVPLLRGRVYLHELAPDLARPQLEEALELAMGSPEAVARVRNLLGVVYFELSQPHLALEQHLLCRQSVKSQEINDLNFRVTIYGNLANDYWALNEPHQAIGMYREILPMLDDLNDMQQLAKVYWGMAVAYRAVKDWPHARLYATRALHIYEASDDRAEAASVCLNLAETLIDDRRFEEAAELLQRAERLLEGTGNKAVLSYLYRDYADLARQQSRFKEANQRAKQAVDLARTYYDATRSGEEQAGEVFWQDPVRVYAEALQMEALVEENQGHRAEADHLFEQALSLLEAASFEETRQEIILSYAKVLQERKEFEKAVEFYRRASELQPPKVRRGVS